MYIIPPLMIKPMLHAEYMRSTNLSIINFTPVFTIWSWLLWHIQRPPKCYIRSKPNSAYTKYLFWRVLNVLLTKELLKILLDSVSEKGMWKKSFQDNPEHMATPQVDLETSQCLHMCTLHLQEFHASRTPL